MGADYGASLSPVTRGKSAFFVTRLCPYTFPNVTGSSPAKPSVGLFIDWNNTASPGGINEAIFASKGGSFSSIKSRFDDEWNRGGWAQFAPKVPFLEGNDVNTEKGALKRWARMNFLFDLQKEGRESIAPAISIDEMYEFGRTVEVYEGFDTLLDEIRDHVKKTTGKELWVTVVTNAWAPVIRGTSLVRDGLVDQVVGQEFLHYQADDGRVLAQPAGGVGEETKPLAVRFVAAQERFNFMPGPNPDGARVMPPPRDGAFSIPKHARVALANGFSDKFMIDEIGTDGGVMVGLRYADFTYPQPGVVDNAAKRAKVEKFAKEDSEILEEKYASGKLTALLTADYRTTTVAGQRTRDALKRCVRLAAIANTPDLAHEMIRGNIPEPRLNPQGRGRSVADNFSALGA